jgi:hypothetical protein
VYCISPHQILHTPCQYGMTIFLLESEAGVGAAGKV